LITHILERISLTRPASRESRPPDISKASCAHHDL